MDFKKGPTGKERYISYSLYELNESEVEMIQTAAKRGPAMPAADAAAQKLAAVVAVLGS